jgi:polysaccharide biosynthesis transport protein
MTEQLPDEPVEQHGLVHYVALIRRRQLVFLIPFFLGWLLVWSASWLLPARYTWGTQIRVASDDPDPSGRLQIVADRILNSSRLLHIIDNRNLYADHRARLNPDELAERMRRDIKIEQVRGDERQITSVNIFYSAHNPDVAHQVTAELTSGFITEDESMRLQAAENTTNFLGHQLQAAHQKLLEQEERVRVFKEQHPESGSNVQVLAVLRSELQKLEDALALARQATETSPDPGAGNMLPNKEVLLEQQLDKLRAFRDVLRGRDTDNHPDVRAVTQQINEKEKVLADLKSNAPNPMSPVGVTPTPRNHTGEIKLAKLEHEISALKAQIKHQEMELSQGPALEQELGELTRGYEQSKENYGALLKNKIAADMAVDQLRQHQGQLSRTIDLSRLPLNPDFPNRIKLCGIGLALGFVLGILCAGTLEYFDDRLYSDECLKRLLPTSMIAQIPVLKTHQDKRRQHRTRWMRWALTSFIFASILAGSAITLLSG